MSRAWIEVKGVDKTMEVLSPKGFKLKADRIARETIYEIGLEAQRNAPVDTGLLSSTLTSHIQRSHKAPSGVWDLLQGTEYTKRQEFEHATKSAFIRNAVWKETPKFKQALEREFKRR